MIDIAKLYEMDVASPKNIAVIGDAMIDRYIYGQVTSCQDGVPCFKNVFEGSHFTSPGGAANAARQLDRWRSNVELISFWGGAYGYLGAFNSEQMRFGSMLCFAEPLMQLPLKERHYEKDKIIWRKDTECADYGLSASRLLECRNIAVKALQEMRFDAILVSDYDKGFLDLETLFKIYDIGLLKNIPVVTDAKRAPNYYQGGILKCNREYQTKHRSLGASHHQGLVITNGEQPPYCVGLGAEVYKGSPKHPLPRVPCINHVGAGDCFAAHLALALAHGLSIKDASTIAHSAGRVYVQHRHGRSPYPHEIHKDLHPAGGKILSGFSPSALRQSAPGRMIFTNGVFRLPHAGHAWLLRWAKEQGDVLVVGINDDESARKIRPGEFVLPLSERLEWLQQHQAVDWIIPFTELDPRAIISHLRPDVLVKGNEYAGSRVPGDELVSEILFAPSSPYRRHSTHIVESLLKHGG